MATIIAGMRVASTMTRANIAKRPAQSVAALNTHIAIEEVARSVAALVFFVVIYCSFLRGLASSAYPGCLLTTITVVGAAQGNAQRNAQGNAKNERKTEKSWKKRSKSKK